MADKRLVNYIQNNLKKGYDINALRRFLFKNGYTKQIIEDAITETTGVDDRNNIRLTLMKYQDPEDVRCEIEFWELGDSDFLG